MSEQVSSQALETDEDRAMEQVLRIVRERYPTVAADVVAAHMHRARQRFTDAPIRSFVPVLVERELMTRLRAATIDSNPDAGDA